MQKYFITVLIVSAVATLAACSTNKVLAPTGGSRSDGTIDMSYEFGAFEDPKVDYTSAQVSAQQRCEAWGYKSAEPFGGEKRQCQAFTNNGICARWFVTMTYQCLSGSKPPAN